jgi:hypothetical protein
MIELLHTVIANVAVCCTLRPIYHTCLTKFDAIKLILIHIQEEDPLRLSKDVSVFRVDNLRVIITKVLKIINLLRKYSVYIHTFEGITPGSVVEVKSIRNVITICNTALIINAA